MNSAIGNTDAQNDDQVNTPFFLFLLLHWGLKLMPLAYPCPLPAELQLGDEFTLKFE